MIRNLFSFVKESLQKTTRTYECRCWNILWTDILCMILTLCLLIGNFQEGGASGVFLLGMNWYIYFIYAVWQPIWMTFQCWRCYMSLNEAAGSRCFREFQGWGDSCRELVCVEMLPWQMTEIQGPSLEIVKLTWFNICWFCAECSFTALANWHMSFSENCLHQWIQ